MKQVSQLRLKFLFIVLRDIRVERQIASSKRHCYTVISKLNLTARGNVALNSPEVDIDWRYDNKCGSHLQSQSRLYLCRYCRTVGNMRKMDKNHIIYTTYKMLFQHQLKSSRMSRKQCYNQLQKYLRHSTVFWLKWLVHDLVLVTPPPPLFKVASNTRPCSKLGGTTLSGGRGEVSILSHRPVASSDLKQDRLFFRESVSTSLQLVVA